MKCSKCKRPMYRGMASNLEKLCLPHLKKQTDKIMARKGKKLNISTTANDVLSRYFA